jgi:hypothetical protein
MASSYITCMAVLRNFRTFMQYRILKQVLKILELFQLTFTAVYGFFEINILAPKILYEC